MEGFMRTMYKEEVGRRRLPIFIGIFILLLLVICISDLASNIYVADRSIGLAANIILMTFMGVVIYFSIGKCREKYKYSIIADQFIIYRLRSNEQFILENIEVKDIEYFGRVKDLDKKYEVSAVANYVCKFFKSQTYCCVYKSEEKYKKFYFQPSENFINTMKQVIESEKRMVS
jgi:hypothetical protein